MVAITGFIFTACIGDPPVKPDLDVTLQAHFESISNRDLEAFKSHLTKSDTLYTIVQNGHAFTTLAENIALHEQWFKDPSWVWEGEVVHKVVGGDVAMALVKYHYRAKPGDAPVATWLTYVFQLQDGQWRIVHDQSTALDFVAFARMAGIESSEALELTAGHVAPLTLDALEAPHTLLPASQQLGSGWRSSPTSPSSTSSAPAASVRPPCCPRPSPTPRSRT